MDIFPSDSDWESSSDSGSSVGNDELGFLYGGHACSILSSLDESLGKIDDFLSFERGFVHWDIVCSVSDPTGQMGRVVNIKKFVNLENIWGKIVKAVDSKKLSKIRSISGGDYVVHGPWIGKVDKVVDSLTILFDDGTKCEVNAVDREKVIPISANLLDDSMYPYYPGQRVQVKLSSVSKTTRWLCGSSKDNLDVGTVCFVKAGLVYVDWFACVLGECPAPSRLQYGNDLTLLSSFTHENWQIGDWCILPMADYSEVTEQKIFDAPKLEYIKENSKREAFKKQDSKTNCENIFAIVKTKTVVDVIWQDGSCSFGLDSDSLLPINIVNGHEFWPGQFVLERGTCEAGNQKWGVVNGMDGKERTVKVTWISVGENLENDVKSDQMEEIASAYELVEHPEFSYCYGDLVIKNVDETYKHQLNGKHRMCEDVCEGSHFSVAQPEFSKGFLSCIGCITGLKDGAVEVTWASGLMTKVQPNEIFRVDIDKCESSAAASPFHEQSSEGLNQEMLDYEKQYSNMDRKDLPISDNTATEGKKISWESASFFLPQSTIGFFKSIAASIFGSAGSTSLSSHVSENEHQSETPEEKGILKTCDVCMEMQPLVTDEGKKFEETGSPQEVSIVQENLKLQPSFTSKSAGQFRQFDMVGDCSDHHFLDSAGNGIAQVKKGWMKKVQQEWSILEKDLPDSIYVRVFEETMSLIRAAIVGSRGTPYHDALFFFDIYLPPEYPHEPPLVYYHSGGYRINPNLYESGRVCLSLLNTWAGSGTEIWSQNSSILQVLLSLQALVLNEKPYFNEAGYDKQMGKAEGEKNSISYNEEAFLMTWKSMLCLLRQPPKHFETLVEDHVQKCSQYILSACKAYMEGAPVAQPFGHEQTQQVNQKGSSTGFQIMLSKLFPKLVEAFSSKGVDCSQFT